MSIAFITVIARRLAPWLGALVVIASDAHAAESGGQWAASLHFENDLFADTDSQYTNGIKLTVVSPDLTSAFEDREELHPAFQRAAN